MLTWKDMIEPFIPFEPESICCKDLTKKIEKELKMPVGRSRVGQYIAVLCHEGRVAKRPPKPHEIRLGNTRNNYVKMVYYRPKEVQGV